MIKKKRVGNGCFVKSIKNHPNFTDLLSILGTPLGNRASVSHCVECE